MNYAGLINRAISLSARRNVPRLDIAITTSIWGSRLEESPCIDATVDDAVEDGSVLPLHSSAIDINTAKEHTEENGRTPDYH